MLPGGIVCVGVLLRLAETRCRCCSSARIRKHTLRNEFRTKHAKAVNLAVYKQQLADIEKSFGAMLRQLPSKTEVPNLLVDISQTGLAAALQEKLFQPGQEVKKDFYAELPIKIRLTGSYHEFGAIRQRHRRAAAHRDAARHPDHADRPRARASISCSWI